MLQLSGSENVLFTLYGPSSSEYGKSEVTERSLNMLNTFSVTASLWSREAGFQVTAASKRWVHGKRVLPGGAAAPKQVW